MSTTPEQPRRSDRDPLRRAQRQFRQVIELMERITGMSFSNEPASQPGCGMPGCGSYATCWGCVNAHTPEELECGCDQSMTNHRIGCPERERRRRELRMQELERRQDVMMHDEGVWVTDAWSDPMLMNEAQQLAQRVLADRAGKNPESAVLDDIDELMRSECDEFGRPLDDYQVDRYDRCPRCNSSWHGLPSGLCPGSHADAGDAVAPNESQRYVDQVVSVTRGFSGCDDGLILESEVFEGELDNIYADNLSAWPTIRLWDGEGNQIAGPPVDSPREQPMADFVGLLQQLPEPTTHCDDNWNTSWIAELDRISHTVMGQLIEYAVSVVSSILGIPCGSFDHEEAARNIAQLMELNAPHRGYTLADVERWARTNYREPQALQRLRSAGDNEHARLGDDEERRAVPRPEVCDTPSNSEEGEQDSGT